MLIPYPLADSEVIQSALTLASSLDPGACPTHFHSAFIPIAGYVSLGASNKAETSAYIDSCAEDGIGIFQRLSGGEAVFLSPNCAIYSHILVAQKLPKSSEFFSENLSLVQNALENLGVRGIERKGISDLSINGRKILGCAIYRKQNFLMYQAVINVCEDPLVIQKYLKAPQREPDYRAKRSHAEFVTSLQHEAYFITPQQVVDSLNNTVLV